MRLLAKSALLLTLLVATATTGWSIEGKGVTVNVEAMIGEATLVHESTAGQKDIIIVPTGQTTKTDPTTGKTLLGESTTPNKVNGVVRAIAAAAPDARSGSTGEGCSLGSSPLRQTARPDYNAEVDAAIASELAGLSKGELMMVIAVLNNNARHLCIDASTVAVAVGKIATVRPEEAGEAVFVASLLDPDEADQFAESALAAAPEQAASIEKAKASAEEVKRGFPAETQAPQSSTGEPVIAKEPVAPPEPPPIVQPTPPGGAIGEVPSPE